MATLSTHDTKRGEDVRARIGVLSQVPSLWAELVGGWEQRDPVPRPADRALPVAEHLRRLADRRHRDRRAARTGCTPTPRRPSAKPARPHVVARPRRRLRIRGARLARRGDGRSGRDRAHHSRRPDSTSTRAATAWARSLLQLTVPGMPDIYQGTELGRQPGRPGQPAASRLPRPPRGADRLQPPQDPGGHRRVAAAARPPGHFTSGGYTPVLAAGLGRATTSWRSCAATTCWSRSAGGPCDWPKPVGATPFYPCPPECGPTGSAAAGSAGRWPAADLFADLPVALLERGDG